MENPFAQEPRATWSWLWQVFTGVGLLILLGLHFIANHFIAKGGLRDFADVAAYLRTPIILVLEVLFLVVVTSHADAGRTRDADGFRAFRPVRKAAEPGAHSDRSTDGRLWLVADLGHHPLNRVSSFFPKMFYNKGGVTVEQGCRGRPSPAGARGVPVCSLFLSFYPVET